MPIIRTISNKMPNNTQIVKVTPSVLAKLIQHHTINNLVPSLLTTNDQVTYILKPHLQQKSIIQ